jgi:hypothetical protein
MNMNQCTFPIVQYYNHNTRGFELKKKKRSRKKDLEITKTEEVHYDEKMIVHKKKGTTINKKMGFAEMVTNLSKYVYIRKLLGHFYLIKY